MNDRLTTLRANCATNRHGTRSRYIAGCKCLLCRAANSRYSSERERLRKAGDTRDIVPALAARAHILRLAKKGIGYKQVSAAASVAISIMAQIRNGKRLRIRQSTERAILAVDESARGDAALIPAGPTWRKLNDLIERGFTKTQLGAWLGSTAKVPSLQVNARRITARTAMKVERMCALLEAGKLRRSGSSEVETVTQLRQIRSMAA